MKSSCLSSFFSVKNGGSLKPVGMPTSSTWCVQCDNSDRLFLANCLQASVIRMEDSFLITQSETSDLSDKCFDPQDNDLVKLAPCNNNISDPSNDQLWSLRGKCSPYGGLWSNFTLYNIKRDMCLYYGPVGSL